MLVWIWIFYIILVVLVVSLFIAFVDSFNKNILITTSYGILLIVVFQCVLFLLRLIIKNY